MAADDAATLVIKLLVDADNGSCQSLSEAGRVSQTVQIVRKLTGAVVWGLCRKAVGVAGGGSVGWPGIQFICGSPWG